MWLCVQEDAAKAEHWEAHGNPQSISKRNGGAHWGQLAGLLKASGTLFVTGAAMTVADCALFDLTDNYMRTFGDHMRSQVLPDCPSPVQHGLSTVSLWMGGRASSCMAAFLWALQTQLYASPVGRSLMRVPGTVDHGTIASCALRILYGYREPMRNAVGALLHVRMQLNTVDALVHPSMTPP